ncbi:TlpA disulfide reductase family protein [Paucihalobacter sp.]|uniref:TlpA disulfide reductase family protein n=1 Tax=Paucihalobacter sp. TaxID=2850405 RepID=UPI002FE01EDB
MKKLLSILFIVALISSCKTEEPKPEGYVIDGTAKEIYNGIRVILQTTNEQGRPIPIDTAIVVDEKFKFEGKLDNPEMLYISVNSVTGNLPLIIENSRITIDIDKNNIVNSKVTGSKSNDDYVKFIEGRNQAQLELQSLSIKLDEAKFLKDTENIDFYSDKFQDAVKRNENYALNFVENHPDSYVSLFIVDAQTNLRDVDVDAYETVFNTLSSTLKTSEYGKTITKKIAQVKEAQQKSQRLTIGKKAPNFTAPDMNGNPLSLYDIKGKVTIIDFWAAWCGPCRRENPNVVKVYNQFHDKGLEIIGVSLDGTPRQGDAKAAWLKAVEDDELTWHQVSNLQYFNDPVAKLYDINAIPATYIIDEEGTIIAKNLRGIALEQKIAELLN